MTELERYEDRAPALADPTGGRLVAWAESLSAAGQIGGALCKTSFVPKHFQGRPDEAAAAILFGDEIGLTPTQSLRSVYVIGGQPALYARTMVALVLSHGHEIWTEEDTPSRVTVSGRRKGSSRVETVTWTTDRARKAGYLSNKKYETDPQAMLYARASGDVARRIAPDVLSGIAYTVEEMELAEPAPTTTVKRDAKQTAKRAPRQPEPEPPLDEPVEAEVVEEPDRITDAQLKKLGAMMREQGIESRDARLAYASNVAGRTVGSSKDLTRAEASAVIDALTADAAALSDSEPPLDTP